MHEGERMTTVQMIEKHVRMARELGRDIATGEDAHRIMKIGTGATQINPVQPRSAAQSHGRPTRIPSPYETDKHCRKLTEFSPP